MNNELGETFSKHNELYENYKKKEMKLQSLTDQIYGGYSYTPEINNYNFDSNFYERQEIFKLKKQEKEKE